MHRDPAPGIFDLGARSARYTLGLGLLSGFALSILLSVGLLIWRAESGGTRKPAPGALENSIAARVTPSPTPAASAVRY